MHGMVRTYRPRRILERHTSHVIRLAIATLDDHAESRVRSHSDQQRPRDRPMLLPMTDPPTTPRRLLWITPEVQGGIASYSQMLWPAVAEAATAAGDFAPLTLLRTAPVVRADAISAARELKPDLVHVQHEYGLFGGLNPVRDRFPGWIQTQLRRSYRPTRAPRPGGGDGVCA